MPRKSCVGQTACSLAHGVSLVNASNVVAFVAWTCDLCIDCVFSSSLSTDVIGRCVVAGWQGEGCWVEPDFDVWSQSLEWKWGASSKSRCVPLGSPPRFLSNALILLYNSWFFYQQYDHCSCCLCFSLGPRVLDTEWRGSIVVKHIRRITQHCTNSSPESAVPCAAWASHRTAHDCGECSGAWIPEGIMGIFHHAVAASICVLHLLYGHSGPLFWPNPPPWWCQGVQCSNQRLCFHSNSSL